MNCDCEYGCSWCADTSVSCESPDCGERVDHEGQEDKTLLAPGGLPYCSIGCKLYELGCVVLDNLPLELRGMTDAERDYCAGTGRAKAVAS